VAALHLEDQVMQKRCGHLGGKELVDEATFLARIRAAVAARERTGGDIVIIARTDALQSLGFDAAVDRLKKAVEAGADMCFLEGMTSKEQMAESVKQLAPTPCMLNMVNGGVTPLVDAKEAQAMGYALVIWPIFALMAAFNAYEKAAQELKSTGFLADMKDSQDGPVRGGVREVFELCGMSKCVAFDMEMGGATYSKGGP
jgi:2-methylisocitrate lyase-like PEP mutase family enzyme